MNIVDEVFLHNGEVSDDVNLQVTEPALRPDKPEPEGHVAGGEPVPAHAQVPDGGRRADRGEGAHLLPAAPAALPQPG